MDNENKSSLKVEDIVFLQGLQHELDIQPTDGQAAPRFWVVADTRKIAGSPDCCDGADLYDVDSCSIAIPDVTLESMVEFFKEKYSDVFYDKRLDIKEANDLEESFSNKVYALYKVASETEELELIEHLFDEDDVLNALEDYDIISHNEFVLQFYTLERTYIQPDTMFITKSSCKKHITQNHYHYNNPRTYAMTAWRSPEIERLWKILQETDFDELLRLVRERDANRKQNMEQLNKLTKEIRNTPI